jgi:chromosomal replication initiator protein
MYLAKNLTNCSYPQIGSRFGDRDHTTVMHAVRKIEDMMTEDRQMADDVVMIRSLLST